MRQPLLRARYFSHRALASIVLAGVVAGLSAEQRPPANTSERPCSDGALDPTCAKIGMAPVRLPAEPMTFDTAEQHKLRVVVVTKELVHPWSLAFLPDGGLLVTERPGRLRVVRNGALDPRPISGVPAVHAVGLLGLLDIALHPRFADNKLLYLSYSKPVQGGRPTTALARARLEGSALVEVRDIFVAEPSAGEIGRASCRERV